MVYVVLLLIVAFVGYDAYTRRNNWMGWVLSTCVGSPVVLPVYLALRNLKAGEKRTGGRGWNILKYFALCWTALMALWALHGVFLAAEQSAAAPSEAAEIGTAIGATIGLGLIGFFWFGGLVCALLLGFFLKDDTIVEEGPTGALRMAEQMDHA